MEVSVIIPAKNESATIGALVGKIRQHCPDAEILVVNDGSTDNTTELATEAGAAVISHPRSMGNGAAIKAGAREAKGEILVMLDADGQHDPAEIPRLLAQLEAGYDMAVGARSGTAHANTARLAANGMHNVLASLITGHIIPDLTSGFRAVRAGLFKNFLYLLPNGFSYPTTITMAFLRAGYPVDFVPIQAQKRVGRSHIRPIRDGIRFLIIIFKIATLYAPLKIFLPASFFFFVVGFGYYVYSYSTLGRFTNMSRFCADGFRIHGMMGLIYIESSWHGGQRLNTAQKDDY